MRFLLNMRLRSRLLAGFLLCAVLAAAAGGAGILSLQQIHGRMESSATDIAALIDHQNAQGREVAALRAAVQSIVGATKTNAVNQAATQLAQLRAAGNVSNGERARLFDSIADMAVRKTDQLHAASALEELQQASDTLIQEIAGMAEHMATTAETDATGVIEKTLTQFETSTATSQATVSNSLTSLGEQASKALLGIRMALMLRSRGQELDIIVKDALLASDPAAVDYTRTTVTTLLDNAGRELAELPENDTTQSLTEGFAALPQPRRSRIGRQEGDPQQQAGRAAKRRSTAGPGR